MSDNYRHNILWYAFMTLVMFCYIYHFKLTILGLPEQIHSVRVAALILYAIFTFKLFSSQLSVYNEGKRAIRFYRRLFVFHIFLFIYMVILYISIGFVEGTHMAVVLINFFFITLIPIYLCSKIFDNIDEFLIVILCATFVQTIIIWLCIIFPNISSIIDHTLNADLEYYERFRSGYAGGLGCITAPGYIRYSLGQLSCFYFYISRRDVKFLFIYLVLLLTGSMVARTGLLAGGIGLIFMILLTFKNKSMAAIILMMFLAIFVLLVASQILSNNIANEFFAERFHRMEDLISSSKEWGLFNDAFFEGYFNGETTVIPPLTIETIVGTGVPAGTAGNGISVNVDGGWFRLYVAYGLILALLFYMYMFGSMLYETHMQKNAVARNTLMLTIIFLAIAEFKEWSIYGSPFILFFTVILILLSRPTIRN